MQEILNTIESQILRASSDEERAELTKKYNLIKAAPRMLEALVEVTTLFDNCPQTLEYVGTMQLVNDAIYHAQK